MISENNIKNEKPSDGLEEFVEEFFNDRLKEMKVLKEMIDHKKLSDIKSLAHRWKGFCKPYGFNLLGDLSINLEKAAISKDFESCHVIFEQMCSYLNIKKSFL